MSGFNVPPGVSPTDIPGNEPEQHEPSYCRHQRGCAPITGRPVYGWSVKCSCGWKQSTNENKHRVEQLFRAHVKNPA